MTEAVKSAPGLSNVSQEEWPKLSAKELEDKPINLVKPGSPRHTTVLDYLVKRINMSERKMSQFYSRWRVAERRVQAYIDLNDYERLLKSQNKDSKSPLATEITVPYCFATQATIVTYLVQTFLGRKPIFQIDNYKGEAAQNAQKMEIVLQYNADATRLQKHLFQFFNDGELYGLGVLRTAWKKKQAMRTNFSKPLVDPGNSPFLQGLINAVGGGPRKTRALRTVYEGNDVCSVDPFMFFPDPRVPMQDVNRRGEFVWWRSYEGKHTLKQMEADGTFSWVDYAPKMPRTSARTDGEGPDASARAVLSGGDATPGLNNSSSFTGSDFYQVDQGTVMIIPAELGLGASTQIERWLFTIVNKGQIVQAVRFDADHDMHPVAVTEPYSMGYGFGQPSLHDYAGDMQDTMTWFINSHIKNVRTAINNMFVVDPSMIEMQDLKNPKPGKLIRLKRAAYGQDVRGALQQLTVQDITRTHVNDMQLFMRLGDALSAVNDNVRGLQDAGGRKTATEVRTAGEAAASRLASHARLISSQAIVDLTEQMSINLQQYLSDEFYISIVGQEGNTVPLRVSPDQLAGDFQYPVNDGTLPLDKVALLDVWQQIMIACMKDQELRQQYSVPKMFEYAAELAGARNIAAFKIAGGAQINLQPTEAVDAAAQAGNIVPIGGRAQVRGLEGEPPGNRLMT